jgi:GntR family transcriptional regulator, transcriptional repressor for pyruvate dehydrogenase complex
MTRAKADPRAPRVPLTEVVSGQLLELLRSENLAEGDSIPPTGELAARFNVSRTVIRESLAELTGRGLLKRHQGREGVVAMPGEHQLMQVFESRVDGEVVSLDQLHEFREALEVGAARGAARRATGVEVAVMSDRLGAMKTATDEHALLAADVDFHRAIAETAGPLFGLVMDGLNPLLMESRLEVWAAYVDHGGNVSETLARHTELRDAIAAGDEDAAAAAMLADLSDTRRGLTEL